MEIEREKKETKRWHRCMHTCVLRVVAW